MKVLFVIKPDGLKNAANIISYLSGEQVDILWSRRCVLSSSIAESLYEVHKKRYFFDSLVRYMTMGTSMVLCLDCSRSGKDINTIKAEIRENEDCKGYTTDELNGELCQFLLKSIADAGGDGAISIREAIGASDASGSFLDEFTKEFSRTFDTVHCSDKPEEAKNEVALFEKFLWESSCVLSARTDCASATEAIELQGVVRDMRGSFDMGNAIEIIFDKLKSKANPQKNLDHAPGFDASLQQSGSARASGSFTSSQLASPSQTMEDQGDGLTKKPGFFNTTQESGSGSVVSVSSVPGSGGE